MPVRDGILYEFGHMNITTVLNVYKADALRTNSDYI